MKRHTFLILLKALLLISMSSGLWGQGPKVNRIKTTTAQQAYITDTDLLSADEFGKSQVFTYGDGLGRNVQTIAVKAGPILEDIITFSRYEQTGIQRFSYLPFALANNEGEYVIDAYTQQLAYYAAPPSGIAATNYPYAETIIQKSPLQIALESGSVGAAWQPANSDPESGHTIKETIRTNDTAVEEVRIWVFDEVNKTATTTEQYSNGQLSVVEVSDENDQVAIEYTDKAGKLILRKSWKDATTELLTYHVYDEYDNLRLILPPMACDAMSGAWDLSSTQANSQSIQDNWATYFDYDNYQRLIEKKLPEAEPIYTIYDRLNRPILSQDGELRKNDQWLFSKFDERSRGILAGIYTDTQARSRETLQSWVDDNVGIGKTHPYYEERSNIDVALYHGYSNQAFPNTGIEILSVSYFDNYDFDFDDKPDWTFQEDSDYPDLEPNDKLNGVATGGKIKILAPEQTAAVFSGSATYSSCPTSPSTLYYEGESIILADGFVSNAGQNVYIGSGLDIPADLISVEWLTSVSFFDKFGRVIQTQSANHLGGADVTWTSFDFAGRMINGKSKHTTPGDTITQESSATYDHAGRVLETKHRINEDPWVLVTSNNYNQLGRATEKDIHSTNFDSSNPTYLQSVDYSFNERGWMTAINNSDLSDDGTDGHASADLFGMEFHYEDGFSQLASDQLYNGTITATTWKTARDSEKHGYGYQYDDLYQLKTARYGNEFENWSDDNYYNVNQLSYDLHGNIEAVVRTNEAGATIDDLTYHYENGNRLLGVDEAATANAGMDFADNGSTWSSGNDEYVYDDNGNMTRDDNKGITNIVYNYLNLPEKVEFADGNLVEWIYDSGGSKLRKIVTTDNNGVLTTTKTDYLGGFVYQDDELDFVSTGEGRIEVSGSDFEYQYHLTDHLGNVRVAFADINEDGIIDTNTEIKQDVHYYPFGMQLPNLADLSGSNNKYLYNGKELEDDHGLNWYHYGARYYDPQLGRWHAVDPADEFNSPYTYVGNNPVNLVDPDGTQSDAPNVSGIPIDVIELMFQAYMDRISQPPVDLYASLSSAIDNILRDNDHPLDFEMELTNENKLILRYDIEIIKKTKIFSLWGWEWTIETRDIISHEINFEHSFSIASYYASTRDNMIRDGVLKIIGSFDYGLSTLKTWVENNHARSREGRDKAEFAENAHSNTARGLSGVVTMWRWPRDKELISRPNGRQRYKNYVQSIFFDKHHRLLMQGYIGTFSFGKRGPIYPFRRNVPNWDQP